MRQVAGFPLWLGHAGDSRDLRAVLAAGIEAVVDLAVNEPPMRVTRDLTYIRLPLVDGSGNPPWLLRLAVDSVAALLREGTPTLVFCSIGISRTPAVVAAAVARVRVCSFHEALRLVVAEGPSDVSPVLVGELLAALGADCGPQTR
jgi:protein-tyrosine phosphatase